jgi:hypothetical protein
MRDGSGAAKLQWAGIRSGGDNVKHLRMAAVLLCSAAAAMAVWLVPGIASASAPPAHATVPSDCQVLHGLAYGRAFDGDPLEMSLDVENPCGGFYVQIHRNGVTVATLTSTTGIMDEPWLHPCRSTDWTTWSDSLGDMLTAPCG